MAGASERAVPRAHYDVVVVGGGHNGLAAAAYAARAGRSCLLLERTGETGGAAVSHRAFDGVDANISRYSYLVSLLPSLIVRELGLGVTLAPRAVSSYTPDPRVGGASGLLVCGDERATAQSFRRVTGGEREHRAWRSFYDMTGRVARAVFPTLTEPLISREQMRARIGDEAAWRAIFEQPIGESVQAAFADDLVRGVVLTDALIGTFAAAGDAGLRQNRCFLYHVIGGGTGEWNLPVGGMGALSAALARAAGQAGATLRTDAEVTALHPDSAGVEVVFRREDEEGRVRAGHVLFGAAPAHLDRLLGRPAPLPEGSQLKLNMVLSRLPRLRERAARPESAFAGTFHVNESAAQLQRAHEEAALGRIPSLPPCECYCHTLTDPGILGPAERAAGVQTLTVFALHMPARLFAADPDGARDAAAAATLRSIDSVLAEPLAGCLLSAADGEPCLEARTPLDLERELAMPAGHIFHRDLAWPFAENAEDVGRWGVETSEPRILLCGAGARRGGGVSAVAGRNAAMALLGRG